MLHPSRKPSSSPPPKAVVMAEGVMAHYAAFPAFFEISGGSLDRVPGIRGGIFLRR
jgi:hypothetical protein